MSMVDIRSIVVMSHAVPPAMLLIYSSFYIQIYFQILTDVNNLDIVTEIQNGTGIVELEFSLV